MIIVSNMFVILIAALHMYFLVLEMFLWTEPLGRKTFGNSVEFAEATKALAANQGLYNGFLSAGLLWGVVSGNPEFKFFFLGCVIVAGIYGAVSVSRRIFFVQALPGLIALVFVLLSS